MTQDGLPALSDHSEQHRITLDAERHLFRVDVDGSVAALGEMGPRLEIKTPSPDAAATALDAVNGSGEAKVIPWRGLELLSRPCSATALRATALCRTENSK